VRPRKDKRGVDLFSDALLEQFGFVQVGQWLLSARHGSVAHLANLRGINFELQPSAATKRNVVYAFSFSGTPHYIGTSSAVRGVRSRFESYRYGNPLVRDTDNRVKKNITRHLEEGGAVTIWLAEPMAEPMAELRLPNEVVRVPACKLLEDYVIEQLRPAANVHVVKHEC
jgi:hypothetical protein